MELNNLKLFIKQSFIIKGYRFIGSQRNILTLEKPSTSGSRYQFNKHTGSADFSRKKPENIDVVIEPKENIYKITMYVAGTSNVIHRELFSEDELNKLIEDKDYNRFSKRLEGLIIAPR